MKTLHLSRSYKGHTLVEISSTSFIVLVIGLFCLNIAFTLWGAILNDVSARDAARAAGQTNNEKDALRAALVSVQCHKTDGFFISQPNIVDASNNLQPIPATNGSKPAGYQNASGTFKYITLPSELNPAEPDTSPYVVVTTSCNIRLPAPILFFDFRINNNQSLSFTRQYVFPIIGATFIPPPPPISPTPAAIPPVNTPSPPTSSPTSAIVPPEPPPNIYVPPPPVGIGNPG
jgi:hypothetical protein